MSELPNGWVNLKLGEVISYGKTEKSDAVDIPEDAWLLELEDIEKNSSKLLNKLKFSERKAKSTKNKFRKGDVLYGKLRPYLDKVIIADEDGYCTTEIIPLKPTEEVDGRFLFYSLKRKEFLDYVNSVSHGVNMPRLGTKQGKEAPFTLAPIEEQKRIADKLDSVLAKVEAARARLDKIPVILKRFRQSVLAAATSGELTKDWSEDRDKKNWLEYTLNDIADIRDPHPSHRTPKIVEGGVPYIGIGDISNKGVINFENARKVSEEVLKEHNKRYQLNEGDFVFGKIGTLGRATKLPIGIDYTLSANVILIQPKSESVVPEYLMLFLSSPSTMDEIAKQANSTSQSAFGIKKMRAFSTRLPSLAEQKEIVSQINLFFEHANTVEKQYDAAIARLDKLNQSILARAFKGELFARSVKSEIKDIENSVEAIHA
ncbi:restriction endonuclease subunit S [Alteromonas macleodii]|uniref:restriction endonuclease subunit S n=1 Tax=Alteromonas macleodii TaxID=28108 RepID=UPI00066A6799|nr:restriction endonuclease subunit S [Alteromonas macleodii]CAI3966812.1 S subunit [Alteromonas macleodii]VTP55291.1 S subunit [Alteromonas macleodii]